MTKLQYVGYFYEKVVGTAIIDLVLMPPTFYCRPVLAHLI